jgi:predicted Zn-dependent peptidase
MADRYRAGRVFIAAAGMVDHKRLVDDCARLFGGVSGDGRGEPIAPPLDRTVVINQEKDLEQTHLCIGGPGISQASPLRYASYVLNTALGGGMSSRLFQEARERLGLAYAIDAFAEAYADGGMLGIYAGCAGPDASRLVEVAAGEILALAGGVEVAELSRAKAQLKASLFMSRESLLARAEQAAFQLLTFGRLLPSSEIAERVDAVGPRELAAVASRMLAPALCVGAVLGPGSTQKAPTRFEKALFA